MEPNQYSLKKIVIVGIIILLLAALAGYFLLKPKNIPDEGTTSGKNIFPFGNGTNNQGTPKPDTTPDDTTTAVENEDLLKIASADRLRQITNYPVTGFFATLVNKVVTEPKLDEKTNTTKLVSSIIPVNMLRFNNKQTGFLMDSEVASDSIITNQKTSTELPGAIELWLGNVGNTALFRTFSTANNSIETFTGTVPAPVIALGYCTVPFSENLKQGSKGPEVRELQKYMNYKLKIGLTLDGSLGPKTYALIKQLQGALSLQPTGVYGIELRDAINADCATVRDEFIKQQSEPVKLVGGAFLTPNILRGSVSPDGRQIFFLKPAAVGVTGVIANSDGSGQRNIFTSALSEWSPQWINATTIAMTTMASREADGYLYFLDTTNGNFKKILGPIRGLTTNTNPDGKMVLYSQSTNSGITTHLYMTDTGVVRQSDLATLPAKCVWQNTTVVVCGIPRSIPNNQYPDAWYQGLVSFSDVIWSLDTTQSSTRMVMAPTQNLDVIQLKMSPDKQYLYFINKIDETLWVLRMN